MTKKAENLNTPLQPSFDIAGIRQRALTKIKAICSRTLEMNLKNDIKDEYSRMDNALEEIWDICHKLTE